MTSSKPVKLLYPFIDNVLNTVTTEYESRINGFLIKHDYCYVPKVVNGACLYTTTNEKKLACLTISKACVLARVTLSLASCLHYNTHISPFF